MYAGPDIFVLVKSRNNSYIRDTNSHIMFDSNHFHPSMVHFPIALIAVGFFFDLYGVLSGKDKCLSVTGYRLELLGMIGTVLAYGTGYFFTSTMEGEGEVVRAEHELFATISLITVIVATLFRTVLNYLGKDNTRLKYVSLSMYLLSMIFILLTGYLGGILVINYMIGL